MPATPLPTLRLAAAAALLTLAACAHRPAPKLGVRPAAAPSLTSYVVPSPSGNTATLVMRSQLASGNSYVVNVYAEAQRCDGRQRLGKRIGADDPTATALAAERWQTLEVVIAQPGNYTCTVRLSFAPRNARAYRMTTTSSDKGCRAVVVDATDPGEPQLESTLRYRIDGSQPCVPLAQAKSFLVDRVPQQTVRVTELPTDPDDGAPAVIRPAPEEKDSDATTVDHLRGLIGP